MWTAGQIVFNDLIEEDKLILPHVWQNESKKVRSIKAMSVSKAVDIMTTIIYDKIKADAAAKDRGAALVDIASFTVDYFRMKKGEHGYQREFKSFIKTLRFLADDEFNPVNDLAVLFSQMCGVTTPSGRLVPIPEGATNFTLAHLGGVQKILQETTKLWGRKKGQLKAVNGGSTTTVNVTSGKSGMLVTGQLSFTPTREYLENVLKKDLGLIAQSPLFRVSIMALAALSVDTPDAKNKQRLVPCMHFTVLLGVIFAAWDKTVTIHGHGRKSTYVAMVEAKSSKMAKGGIVIGSPSVGSGKKDPMASMEERRTGPELG